MGKCKIISNLTLDYGKNILACFAILVFYTCYFENKRLIANKYFGIISPNELTSYRDLTYAISSTPGVSNSNLYRGPHLDGKSLRRPHYTIRRPLRAALITLGEPHAARGPRVWCPCPTLTLPGAYLPSIILLSLTPPPTHCCRETITFAQPFRGFWFIILVKIL